MTMLSVITGIFVVLRSVFYLLTLWAPFAQEGEINGALGPLGH